MSGVRELHDTAMDYTDQALRERGLGNAKRSQELFERALEMEMGAISQLPKQAGLLWSVLHRSAGTLALDCGDYRLAERLACKALAGEPDPEIAEELRELLDAVFERMGRAKKADAA